LMVDHSFCSSTFSRIPSPDSPTHRFTLRGRINRLAPWRYRERERAARGSPHGASPGRPTTPSASVDGSDQSTGGARRCSACVTSRHPVLISPRCRSPRDRPPAEALNAALVSAERSPRAMEWCRGLRVLRSEGFPAARSRSRYLHRAHRPMVPVDSGFVSHHRTSGLGFETNGPFGPGAGLNATVCRHRSIE